MREKTPPLFPSPGLRLISYCPLCNTHYSMRDAVVLEGYEETQLMHVVCKSCSSSIIILMLTGELGMSSVGLITDLTGNDVMKFKEGNAVDADDVLELHCVLREDSTTLW